MNTIKEFLQRQEASTVKDIAEYGIESGAIGELIYTQDIVDFFNRYYNNISNRSIFTLRTAKDLDAHDTTGPRIICNVEICLHLNHDWLPSLNLFILHDLL